MPAANDDWNSYLTTTRCHVPDDVEIIEPDTQAAPRHLLTNGLLFVDFEGMIGQPKPLAKAKPAPQPKGEPIHAFLRILRSYDGLWRSGAFSERVPRRSCSVCSGDLPRGAGHTCHLANRYTEKGLGVLFGGVTSVWEFALSASHGVLGIVISDTERPVLIAIEIDGRDCVLVVYPHHWNDVLSVVGEVVASLTDLLAGNLSTWSKRAKYLERHCRIGTTTKAELRQRATLRGRP